MNPLYIIGIFFFASYCSGQTEQTNPTININHKNMVQCETHMQVHEISYVWIIRNFSAHKTLRREVLSPKLRAPTTDRIEWDLRLYPPYSRTLRDYSEIGFYNFVSNESKVEDAIAECNISIINHKKEVLLHKHYAKSQRCKPGVGNKWHTFEILCKDDDFFRNHLLQNDTLTMVIHLKWFFEPSHNVSHQRKILSPHPIPDSAIMKNNLSTNFEYMLENPEFADVVFITNGTNYPAHKNILAARSPVFAAIFRRKDTKNGKNKKIRINVTNMDGDVLRSMLRYIYTGECENLDKLADKLLAAAIKYRLDGLRRICEQTLRQTRSSDTAA
ncbi:protein roadkill-like isoform X2 [Planococcus citri]|uniref:protein roadkill-like isoform X2 n=1 Tax=Planococcus citri TaxID=170843 RepID=UPI0031F9FA4D